MGFGKALGKAGDLTLFFFSFGNIFVAAPIFYLDLIDNILRYLEVYLLRYGFRNLGDFLTDVLVDIFFGIPLFYHDIQAVSYLRVLFSVGLIFPYFVIISSAIFIYLV